MSQSAVTPVEKSVAQASRTQGFPLMAVVSETEMLELEELRLQVVFGSCVLDVEVVVETLLLEKSETTEVLVFFSGNPVLLFDEERNRKREG